MKEHILTHTGIQIVSRPSNEDAMEAVKTLLRYAGDDPNREGLKDTPKRVIKAYDEFWSF